MSATSTMRQFLKAEICSVNDFLTDEKAPRKFVPDYQRGYSWNDKQMKALLHDINSSMRCERGHFLGTMLCVRRNGAEYDEIVDGQQRLTSLILIFAWAMHWVERETDSSAALVRASENFFELKKELKRILYYEKKSSVQDFPYRLQPGEIDEKAYYQIVRDGAPNHGGKEYRHFTEVYHTIEKELSPKAENSSRGVGYMKKFIEFIKNDVFIAVIIISDDEKINSHEIFEVLNERGKDLMPIDLIKNKIFSCFRDTREAKNFRDAARCIWGEIFAACKDDASQVEEYVRSYLQMVKGKNIPPKELYPHLRDNDFKGSEAARAIKLLQNLHDKKDVFNALFDKRAKFLRSNGYGSDAEMHVQYLKKYRVTYTLALAILLQAEKQKGFVCDALRILCFFIKRLRATHERFPNFEYYEDTFAKLARKLYKKPIATEEFFEEIVNIDSKGDVIIPDQKFIEEMSYRRWNNSSDARLTLVDIYEIVQPGYMPGPGSAPLEHILPKKWDERKWPCFQDKMDAENSSVMLGNFVLLERNLHDQISGKDFSQKKTFYTESKFSLTQQVGASREYEWTRKNILARSAELAEKAAKAWSFDDFNKYSSNTHSSD